MKLPPLDRPWPTAKAVRWLAAALYAYQDATGAAKRVRGRLRYHQQWPASGHYENPRALLEWAARQRGWGHLQRLVAVPHVVAPPPARLTITAHAPLVAVLPAGAEELREALLAALHDNQRLRDEAAALRPDAEAWRALLAERRSYGARGGRPRGG
jgi:hypothetical protein